MKQLIKIALVGILLYSCQPKSKLPVIEPDIITERTAYDSDDPAIWVHPTDPSQSIVFGTDKDSDGGIYAFDLEGKILRDKSILRMKRPNNVDVGYGMRLSDSTSTDFLVFTERERSMLRVFSIPEMEALDGGGFPVFAQAKEPDTTYPWGSP